MRKEHRYYVYIMTNRSRNFYVGVTSKLQTRTAQHKDGEFGGFTSKYKLDRLIYFEVFSDIRTAISREKQLKGGAESRKLDSLSQ